MNQSDNYPSVLIVSHNALSDTQNNGKTMNAFFTGWPKDKIAQLFVTLETPSIAVCKNFYRITDIEILKSVFFDSISVGCELTEQTLNVDGERKALHKKKSYNFVRNLFLKKVPICCSMREFCWGRQKWKTEKLKSWLDKIAPEVVFFQGSDCATIYDMVFWICDYLNIPLVLQLTDDYVSSKFTLDPFWWFNHFAYKKRFVRAVKTAHRVIAVGEKMAAEYSRRYGGQYYVGMNCIETDSINDYIPKNEKLRMIFAGNLGLNRWKILAELGKYCFEDKTLSNNVEIKIYSLNTPNKSILKQLNLGKVMQFCGALTSEQLRNVVEGADVLIHTEAFDRKNRHVTRYSISTKIPEYMARKRCILAIGPNDVASIQYIQKYDLGAVVTSLNQKSLTDCVKMLVNDPEYRINHAKHGFKRAMQYHSPKKTQDDIRLIMQSALLE